MQLEEKVLKTLVLNSERYVSNIELAKELGVAPSSIDEAVKRLELKGYVIENDSKLGYRLAIEDDLSLIKKFSMRLDTKIRYNFYYMKTCSSTQDVATSLALQGAEEGTIVIAEEMEQGRGRLRRKWIASSGGLWFSIVFTPRSVKNLQLLTLGIGIGVARGINKITGLDTKLKWPNDVLLNNKKVSGILIETKAGIDNKDYIIAGVGVNVNNILPPELTDYAISISMALGKKIPRIPVLISILEEIDKYYELLLTERHKELINDWKGMSDTINSEVEIIMDNERITGLAIDLSDDGALLVKTTDMKIHKIFYGDVIHLRRKSGNY